MDDKKNSATGPGPLELVGARPTPSRRERVRAATIDEIKRHAWTQIEAGGAGAMSLRSIAHSMGMTSSALYRYFASHEQLVTELAADAFSSLADTLEASVATIPADTPARTRFLTVTGAYRKWAIEHATEYALMFGTPMKQVCTNPRVELEHRRGVTVLFQMMIEALAAGELDPSHLPPIVPAYERQLATWRANLELPLPVEALAGCMFAWTQLHGAISLELFGQLPFELLPADEMFELQMQATLSGLGCVDAAPSTR